MHVDRVRGGFDRSMIADRDDDRGSRPRCEVPGREARRDRTYGLVREQLSQMREFGGRAGEDQSVTHALAQRGVDCRICGADRLGVGSDHEDRMLEPGREHIESLGEIGKAHEDCRQAARNARLQPKLT
jgi:hypothetical protein